MKQAVRKRFQFRIRDMLALLLCIGMLLSIAMSAFARLGYESADVEVTGFTDEPNRTQLKYTVRYRGGVAWSATPLPSRIPEARFAALIGKQFQIRYRAVQVLWLEPEIPYTIANREIQRVIDDVAASQNQRSSES